MRAQISSDALSIQVVIDDEVVGLRFHFETSQRGRRHRPFSPSNRPILNGLELMPCLSS